MTSENIDIARIFDQVADLLEVNGADYYRVRAYRNASRVIRDLSTPLRLTAASNEKNLEDLPGIGKDLAGRIREILDTGDLALREELETQLPGSLLEIMKVPGLGPRKTHELFLELGVTDLDGLEEAAASGKVRRLKGFGPGTEQKILEGIHSIKGPGKRVFRSVAEVYARRIIEHMNAIPGLKRIEVAGSYRRLAETVGNLDILVTCDDARAAVERFGEFAPITRVITADPRGGFGDNRPWHPGQIAGGGRGLVRGFTPAFHRVEGARPGPGANGPRPGAQAFRERLVPGGKQSRRQNRGGGLRGAGAAVDTTGTAREQGRDPPGAGRAST